MNKEEVLAKSRQDYTDEGTEYAELKGRKTGEYVMAAVTVAVTLFAGATGQFNVVFAIGVVVCAYATAQSIETYRLSKKISWLISIAPGVLFLFACSVVFVGMTMEWATEWVSIPIGISFAANAILQVCYVVYCIRGYRISKKRNYITYTALSVLLLALSVFLSINIISGRWVPLW